MNTPDEKLAEFHYFDTRADRVLHGTASGESMATWGPLYLRDARARMKLGDRRGTLWERLAERAAQVRVQHTKATSYYGQRPGYTIKVEHDAELEPPIVIEFIAYDQRPLQLVLQRTVTKL